jgi:hypothetical protein
MRTREHDTRKGGEMLLLRGEEYKPSTESVELVKYDGVTAYFEPSSGGVFIVDDESGYRINHGIRKYATVAKAKEYAEKVLAS